MKNGILDPEEAARLILAGGKSGGAGTSRPAASPFLPKAQTPGEVMAQVFSGSGKTATTRTQHTSSPLSGTALPTADTAYLPRAGERRTGTELIPLPTADWGGVKRGLGQSAAFASTAMNGQRARQWVNGATGAGKTVGEQVRGGLDYAMDALGQTGPKDEKARVNALNAQIKALEEQGFEDYLMQVGAARSPYQGQDPRTAGTGGSTGADTLPALKAERDAILKAHPELREPGALEWLGKNVSAGMTQFNNGLFSTLDFFLPTELLFGEHDPVSALNRYYSEQNQYGAAAAQEVNEKKGGLWKGAGELAVQGTVSAIPNAVLALMTAGASLGAQGGAALSTAASSGLGSTLASVGQNMTRNPAFWSSVLQTTGPAYEEAKAEGAGEMQATVSALITGLLSSGVEVRGGIETLPQELLQDTTRSGVRKWVDSMLEEGGEEVVQGVIQALSEKMTYDQDRPYLPRAGEDAVFDPARAVQEFAGGAIAGGILGAGQIGIQKAAQGIQTRYGARTGGDMIQKEGPTTSEMDADRTAPIRTSATPEPVFPSDAMIPQGAGSVKGEDTWTDGGFLPRAEETGSTAINTDPAIHTPEEQTIIDQYQSAVDADFLSYYQSVQDGETKSPYYLRPVSERAASDIKNLVGRDTSGFQTRIDARQAQHINLDHGERGRADHSMSDPNDVARIQYVLDNYDSATDGGQTDAYWEPKENGKNRQAKVVVFSKKVNGTYYVVEAAPVSKAKSVYVVSAYMLEKGRTPPGRGGKGIKTEGTVQPPDASAPWFTAETDSAHEPSVLDSTIPFAPSEVKGEDARRGGGVFLPRAGETVTPGYLPRAGESAVDTLVPSAYNGEKEALRHGGREKGALDLEELYGADVRGEADGLDAGGIRRGREIPGVRPGTQAGGAKTARWAEGHTVDDTGYRPAEIARGYAPDVFVVEDAALKAHSADALGLTSGGVIYLSDAIPQHLQQVVPCHEAVHAAKQRGDPGYRSFLDETAEKVNFSTETLRDAIKIILKARFPGKTLFDLSVEETGTVYDELNAVVWGFHKADPVNAREQFAGAFTDYDGYIRDLDAILDRGMGTEDTTRPPDASASARGPSDSAPGMTPGIKSRYSAGEATGGADGYWDALIQDVERREGTPETAEAQEAAGYWDALLDWVDGSTKGFEAPRASVTTERTAAQKTAGERAGEAWSYFKRKMVDAGEAVGRVGKLAGDDFLYPYYNYARASANAGEYMISPKGAQTDISGKAVGPSLAAVWEPIRAKGRGYYATFQDYLFHRHNVARMSLADVTAAGDAELRRQAFIEAHPDIAYQPEERLWRMVREDGPDSVDAWQYLQLVREVNRAESRQNKPVFGWDIDADKSRDTAANYEREHPEFRELAERVYQYNRNLMQYRVDCGLLTREQADTIEKLYPDYVPTFREGYMPNGTRDAKGVHVGKTVGRAEGGTADLMPLHVAMARQTMQVVREGSKNRFGMRLLDDVLSHEGQVKEHIRSAQEYEREVSGDTFDILDDPTPQRTNTFTVYRDGKAWVMEVDPALYEGVKALSPERGEGNVAVQAVRTANDLFKKLVTGYNPMFMARNFARDLQDAGLYSRDLGAWAQNYPQAVKEIATEGEWWRQYKALGGMYSTIFDYEQGYQTGKEHGALRRNTVDRVAALNMGIEQAPRLAEFMAQVKKNGGGMDSLMDAMHAAADVTVNFGRAGTLGKTLNQNFVPFLNPGIQGFDKMARRFFGRKSGKEWGRLLVRAAALGIVPALLNALLYRDDPEWDTLRDSDKDVNYLIKLGDGQWLKIPKGRDASVLGMLGDRVGDMARGEAVDWGATLKTAANQIAPANPLENNIIAAWSGANLFDPSSPGKTWYGGDIEGQRLQGYAPGQRFDENTDVFSRAVGGALGLSPKKINYILDQYSGVVGDFVLPLLTPSGNKNPFAPFQKAFVLDSVSSNRLSGDFYDAADRISYAKNGGDGAMAVVQRFWNKQAGAVSDVYARIREAENSDMLPNAAMLEQVRQDKGVVNGIQQNALAVLDQYEAAARRYYTGDSDKERDEAYRKANREAFGAAYALKTYNADVYMRAAQCHNQGVDYEDYYDVYFAMRDREDSNGKRDVLLDADLSDEEKVVLYRDRISDKKDEDIAAVLDTGLGFDEFLEAQNQYATINGGKGRAAEKAADFAHWMAGRGYDDRQYRAVREAFQFYSMVPAGETTFEKLAGVGLGTDAAYGLAGKLAALEPETGRTQVSPLQKSRVIVDSGLDAARQVAALGAVMGAGEYLKLSTAYRYGVAPDAYVSYRESLERMGAGENISQEEARRTIDSLAITREEKAALWQLQNASWKPWRNPYSESVGRQVAAAYQSGKNESGGIQLRYGGTGCSGSTEGIQLRYGGGQGQQGAEQGIVLRYTK